MGQCHSCEKRERKAPSPRVVVPPVDTEPREGLIDQQGGVPDAIQVLAEDFDNSALGALQKKLQRRIGKKAVKEFSSEALKAEHGQKWFELFDIINNPVTLEGHVRIQNACRELLAQNKDLTQRLKNRKSQFRAVWALTGAFVTVFIYAVILTGVIFSSALCEWCTNQK